MLIGERLRKLREEKKLSQGDIERRSGVQRSYISSVEHGRITPSIQTLEKLASALEVPMYYLVYDGGKPSAPVLVKWESPDDTAWGSSGKDAKYLNNLRRLLAKLDDKDRSLIMHTLRKMADRR